jgi:hypothetical protein
VYVCADNEFGESKKLHAVVIKENALDSDPKPPEDDLLLAPAAFPIKTGDPFLYVTFKIVPDAFTVTFRLIITKIKLFSNVGVIVADIPGISGVIASVPTVAS